MPEKQQSNPTGKEAIQLHLRTYRSALRSSKEINVDTLIPTYLKMEPLLHEKAGDDGQIDQQAVAYAIPRFPPEILNTKTLVIGQTKQIFKEKGYDISNWKPVTAPKRKRRAYYHLQTKTLALFATSISDVDDIVNLIIALEIELRKADQLGKKRIKSFSLPEDFSGYRIKLLAGTWVNFSKTAQHWWRRVVNESQDQFNLADQPTIFVSSNNHSLINLIDNFCLKHKQEIFKIAKKQHPEIIKQINQSPLKGTKYASYYLSQFAFQADPDLWAKKLKNEKRLGILRIEPNTTLELETQIIPGKLIDSRLQNHAVINIEYPLGFGAFHILEEVFENKHQLTAVYLLGKAAALNTKTGDILIPKVVFDEHTQNTYMIKNAFNNNFDYEFSSGSILDNQKLVSVLGIFLENKGLFDLYSKKGFNIIEMEAGPYLGAVSQATYPQSVPQDTIVDLNKTSFDLGLIYYSSDNPYILDKSLGEVLGLSGVEATYLSTQAIIDRIKSTVNN